MPKLHEAVGVLARRREDYGAFDGSKLLIYLGIGDRGDLPRRPVVVSLFRRGSEGSAAQGEFQTPPMRIGR